MSDKNKRIEDSIKECYSTWGSRYYADYYESSSAYPPVHTDIIRDVLKKEKPESLLDVGCGPASMMRDLADLGVDLYGFDLTPEMVEEAKRVMSEKGVDESRIWQGSAIEQHCYKEGEKDRYGSALCFGVLPHIAEENDRIILSHMKDSVDPGGLVMVEARNELFSLFTLNRPSREFLFDRLIDMNGLKERNEGDAKTFEKVEQELDQRFRMDLPPIRKGYEDEPGYDEVLSRTHNPFELQQLARDVGLKDVHVLFYHYHALPPMVEKMMPDLFRKESVTMEDPTDWRGHFMASAFILVGRV